MECSIGYSFDGETVFVELVEFQEVDMEGVMEYLETLFTEKHDGLTVKDLKALSILIK